MSHRDVAPGRAAWVRSLTRSTRSSPAAPLRTVGVVCLAIMLPVVLLVTLWPTHALLELKPPIMTVLMWLHDHGHVRWLTWVRLEIVANVAMLAPLAFALTLAAGARRWFWCLLGCAALSVAVELVQLLMPGRIASPLDVVANTTGALVGALLALLLETLLRRRGR